MELLQSGAGWETELVPWLSTQLGFGLQASVPGFPRDPEKAPAGGKESSEPG